MTKTSIFAMLMVTMTMTHDIRTDEDDDDDNDDALLPLRRAASICDCFCPGRCRALKSTVNPCAFL